MKQRFVLNNVHKTCSPETLTSSSTVALVVQVADLCRMLVSKDKLTILTPGASISRRTQALEGVHQTHTLTTILTGARQAARTV